MGRDQYRTPEEDVATEFDRICQLFQLALGKPSDRVLFDSLMGEASAQGMNWVQGLEYVVQHRETEEGDSNVTSFPGRGAVSAQEQAAGSGDLRRAG